MIGTETVESFAMAAIASKEKAEAITLGLMSREASTVFPICVIRHASLS
jgi:hypothetical protein